MTLWRAKASSTVVWHVTVQTDPMPARLGRPKSRSQRTSPYSRSDGAPDRSNAPSREQIYCRFFEASATNIWGLEAINRPPHFDLHCTPSIPRASTSLIHIWETHRSDPSASFKEIVLFYFVHSCCGFMVLFCSSCLYYYSPSCCARVVTVTKYCTVARDSKMWRSLQRDSIRKNYDTQVDHCISW
jgi:hypothetical protein